MPNNADTPGYVAALTGPRRNIVTQFRGRHMLWKYHKLIKVLVFLLRSCAA